MKSATTFLALSTLVVPIAALAANSAYDADATVSSLDNPGAVTVASGATVVVTGDVSSDGNTAATRFDKQGAGTLVLKGDNALKRIKNSGGALVFDGGATVVSGGTGTGAANDMNVLLEGAETVVTGGGSFTIGGGSQYAGLRSESTVIENGTFDATAVTLLLCNFMNGSLPLLPSGIVTVGEGGLFRATTMRPHQTGLNPKTAATHGFRIVDGGVLEIAGANGLVLDGAQYGLFHLDGGVVVNSAPGSSTTLFSGNWANSPVTIGEKGGTISNAVQSALQPAVPIKSGAAGDGGLHVAGKGFFNLNSSGNTYVGGTYLDSSEGMLFTLKDDSSLGASPESPRDDVFVRGSNLALFGNVDTALGANRNVAISSNVTFNVIVRTGRKLSFLGEINGAHDPGALPSTTTFATVYQWAPWNNAVYTGGLTVLDPGEGRENNPGRIGVKGNLEIKSGVTRAYSPVSGGVQANAPLHVSGGGSVNPAVASLTVSGGELSIDPESASKYFWAEYGALVDVSGGTIDTANGDYINAAFGGKTTIRDGGVVDAGRFRVTHRTAGNPTVVHLATNGTLRVAHLTIDVNQEHSATFLFDGGALEAKASGWILGDQNGAGSQTAAAAWDGVEFAVGPGGAVFDAGQYNFLWNRPLSSAAGNDGGLVARGKPGSAVVLYVPQSYNGPTTVDGTALQPRGDDILPVGTTLVLKNGGQAQMSHYDAAMTHSAATLGGVAGDGYLRLNSNVTVSGTIAPSVGGTLRFEYPCAIDGTTLEIDGDATGCGKVSFDRYQNISGVSLSVKDVAAFDSRADKTLYKIVDGSYAGRFESASGLGNDWAVSYRADGVYLSHVDALVLVLR